MFLGFLRFVIGLLLLPVCFAVGRSFFQVVMLSRALIVEAAAFIGGVVAFVILWFVFPRPVRMYVLGHELTHALWGLLFFAWPSKLRVSKNGGSVSLTKSNFLITLSPYFFPFYSFVLAVIAVAVSFFYSPLPLMSLWLFALGMSWAFHLLFTFDSLSRYQSDIAEYGKLFSWTIIFIANAAMIIFALAAAGSVTYSEVLNSIAYCTTQTYVWVYSLLREVYNAICM